VDLQPREQEGIDMFVQVMEGRVRDATRLQEQMDLWHRELQPGAEGFLGSTGGVTDSGDCIMIARFATEADARRNSDRPEQGAWWADTEACFDGPVRFHESTDVAVVRHGDADSAGFVQVMEGHVSDREAARRLDEQADEILAQARPDLLESITAYFDDGEFADIAYFRSEEEARDAEGRGVPPELADSFATWEATMRVERYLDLRDPWLTSA
jgi:hypothetical protein